MKVKLISLFFLLLIFAACGEKDHCCDTPGDYSKGIFVVNEGPFGGSGTISWHNPDTGETRDSLFEKANNGAVLGQFVQSLCFHNDKAYIVVNGAGRVVVVDARTFQFIDTIGGLAQPRFFLPLDETTAYVSQWGADGLTGSVAKINLNSNTVIATIPTGKGPEKMIRVGDKVLVANSGGYGKDSTLTEISLPAETTQLLPLAGGLNPATLAWDGARLYFLCKGYYLDPAQTGWLGTLTGGSAGVPTPPNSDDLSLDNRSGSLFFLGGAQVYKVAPGGTTPAVFIASGLQTPYGLSFDSERDLLYCADTKDYVTPGTVYVFNPAGVPVDSFRTGVLPGEIVVK
ncbi:MAG: hypothetical protein SFV22_18290 [Saprospiraceae bacterium]|nr:hypothetical protein [Saprospiraceae bacterium]